MEQTKAFLEANPVGKFATIRKGWIAQRPFKFVKAMEDKFIFITANNKEVYQDLQETPTASFISMGEDGKWLRLSGAVQFSDSMELKEELLNGDPMIKGVYKSADNPVLEVFCIYKGQATLKTGMGQDIEDIQFGME